MTRREWIAGLACGSSAVASSHDLSAELSRIFGAQKGTAVILDAAGGGVIGAHRLDRASTRLASPGSAIKPFTLLALIEQGVLSRSGATRCSDNVEPRCTHPTFAGPIGAAQALAWSCNSWFAQMSDRLDPPPFRALLARYGFGAVTGLRRDESAGELDMPRNQEAVRDMALGVRGVRVTPLGLAASYRRLALARKKRAAEYSELWKGLDAAVLEGTAHAANVNGLSIAGKTGTSMDRGEEFTHAWFAGWAPAALPRVVVSVFLERGKGANDAAPIAGAVLEAWRKWSGWSSH